MFRQKLLSFVATTAKSKFSFSNQFVRSYCSSNVEKTINEVRLLGRVGGEPQKRGTEEHPVVIFHLATHSNYRDGSGEFNQKTDWHRIVIFKPGLRDTVYNFLRKGQRIHVSGRLIYGEMKSEEGNPITTSSVIADDVIFFQS